MHATGAAVMAILLACGLSGCAGSSDDQASRSAPKTQRPRPAPSPSRSPTDAATSRDQGKVSDQAPRGVWQQLLRTGGGRSVSTGRADAPVVMLAWADYQCPFCRRFAEETQPSLVRRYVDSGTLRIEWRDFPYLGPESKRAAYAARAAAEQGRFWAFHRALYAHQPPENSGRITDAYLGALARRVGLDVRRFRRAMDTSRVKTAVERDFAMGRYIGINGTPAFIINGYPVMGAQPLAVFAQTIDKAAAQGPYGR